MVIKKGDFVELDYTAVVVDDDSIFDTTIPSDAEKAGMLCEHDHGEGTPGHTHVTKDDFKPIKVCVGENHVLPGLDEQLVGLDVGEHDIILGEENAFGKKDPKKLKLMPMSAFKKQKINPFPGLTVDMDDSRGVVRSVSGGRVIVDFNHPLSGKTVKYKLNVKRKIEDVKEQVESVLNLARLPVESVNVEGDSVKVKIPLELQESMLDGMKKDLERITNKKIVFDLKKKDEGKSQSDKGDVKEKEDVKKQD